ncbi:hypothetical protein GCM10020295_08120 [Streptomyces cinereospinus]
MREHAEMASGSGRDVAAPTRAVPGLLAEDGAEAGGRAAGRPGDRCEDRRRRAPGPRPGRRRRAARAGVAPDLLTAFAGEPVLGGGRPVGGVGPVRPLAALPPASYAGAGSRTSAPERLVHVRARAAPVHGGTGRGVAELVPEKDLVPTVRLTALLRPVGGVAALDRCPTLTGRSVF